MEVLLNKNKYEYRLEFLMRLKAAHDFATVGSLAGFDLGDCEMLEMFLREG
jgi:hypothetical protein